MYTTYLIAGVKVLTDTTTEEERTLRNNSHHRPERRTTLSLEYVNVSRYLGEYKCKSYNMILHLVGLDMASYVTGGPVACKIVVRNVHIINN